MRSLHKLVIALSLVMMVLLGVTLVGPKAQAAGPVAVPGSIDGSGATDVSAQLQAFLNSVPAGSTVEFPAAARYRVEAGVSVSDRTDLVIDGNGSTLFADTEGVLNRSILKLNRTTDIVVRDLIIRGANPNGGLADDAYRSALEAQHGVQMNGVTAVLLENLTITDVYGDFVYIGPDGSQNWSRQVIVRNSQMARNGRQGVALTAAEDVVIEGNHMVDMRRAVFDIEPNHQWGGARRVRISDNEIGAHRLLFVPMTGAVGAVIEDIEIARNHLFNDYLRVYVNPPDGARRARIAVTDNVSDLEFRSSAVPIVIRRTDDVIVRGNTQRLHPDADMTAVQLREDCRYAVAGNDFTGALVPLFVDLPACPLSAPVAPAAPRLPSDLGAAPTTTTTSTTAAPTTTTTSTTAAPTTTTTAPPGPTSQTQTGVVVTPLAPTVTSSKGAWTASVRWRVTNNGTVVAGAPVAGTFLGDHKVGETGVVSCVTNGAGECTVSATVTNRNSTIRFTTTAPAAAAVIVTRP